MQLNLSLSFITFAHKAGPLSASLALLVHEWPKVVELWVECVEKADDEALRALFECVFRSLRLRCGDLTVLTQRT